MWRYSYSVLVGFVLCLVASTPTYAQSFSITCEKKECEMNPAGVALFSETDFIPGETRFGTFLVHNNQKKDGCQLALRTARTSPVQTPDIAEQIQITISDAYWQYLENTTFAQLFTTQSSKIGIVAPQTSSLYTWEAEFLSQADNSYQGGTLQYDFSIDVTCDKSIVAPPPPTPTATPSTVPDPSSAPKPTKSPKPPRQTRPMSSSQSIQDPARDRSTPEDDRSVLGKIGEVLGVATSSATTQTSTQPGSIFTLVPQELQQLSRTTKVLLVILYVLLSIGMLWLLFLLLFGKKKRRKEAPDPD